jgi:hypothetical protein
MLRGATVTLETVWRMAQVWYHDRLRPEWRRKTPEEVGAFFAELGLSSDFWKLTRKT